MKQQYLLDTNVVIDLLRHKDSSVKEKIGDVGVGACAISEITLYELYCGAYLSSDPEKNISDITKAISYLTILPLSSAYEEAARQRAALRRRGMPIEDFDLLIACTAICTGRVLVSGNTSHMERVEGLHLEFW